MVNFDTEILKVLDNHTQLFGIKNLKLAAILTHSMHKSIKNSHFFVSTEHFLFVLMIMKVC